MRHKPRHSAAHGSPRRGYRPRHLNADAARRVARRGARRHSSKLASLLLALVLCASLIPVGAFAAGAGDAGTPPAAEAGEPASAMEGGNDSGDAGGPEDGELADPSGPGDPSEPSDSEEPIDPGDPADSGDPENPGEPADSENPDDSGNQSTPADPADPADPSDEGDDPASKEGEEGNPDEPTDPDDPGKGKDTAAEDPEKTEEGDNPSDDDADADDGSDDQAREESEPSAEKTKKAVKKLGKAATSLVDSIKLIPQSLEEGDCFYSATDEGSWLVFRVTSENTVEVGHGSAGECTVVNVPPVIDEDGREKQETFPTTDTNDQGDITIPETVRYGDTTYTVTSISNGAFSWYVKYFADVYFHFKSVTIPETVTNIGQGAFYSVLGLGDGVRFDGVPAVETIGTSAFAGSHIRNFDLPQSVTSIGSSLFSGSYLQTFSFPAEPGISYLPDRTFYQTQLQAIEIPDYITIIGNYTFGKTSIREFVLPGSVHTIGTGLFSYANLLNRFEFGEGTPITELPAYTFEHCTAFTHYDFPVFIKSVEQHCFDGAGLAEVFIPKTLTYLGDYAFANCRNMTVFEWEDGHQLLNINPGLLANTINLKSIDLPDNIRSIGASAFAGSGIPNVRIPAKVSSLGEFAFQQCPNLGYVLFEGDASGVTTYSSTFYLSPNIYACVFYDKRCKSIVFRSAMNVVTYCSATYYRSKDDVGKADKVYGRYCVPIGQAPSTLEGTSAFEGLLYNPLEGTNWVCEQGFSLDAEMAESFYVYAKPIVSNLKAGNTFVAYTIENVPVTYTVVRAATANRPGVATVGETTGTMRNSAIDAKTTGAITLTSQVTGPDANLYNVTSIAPYAFSGCNKFATLTVPAGITSIGGHAFYRCTTLRNIYFDSDANKVVDDGIFAGCTNIRLVVFGGKKANVGFGSSSPDVYYTVFFYDTEHDWEIGHLDGKLVVHERAKLDSLNDKQIRSGAMPSLKIGYEWRFEDGFGADIPIEDSFWVYQEGMGFQYEIRVIAGNATKAPCWFKITAEARDGQPGQVQVGLGKDGITAVHQGLTGIPVIPSQVTDPEGNVYDVTSVSDYAFGSENYYDACVRIISMQLPISVTSIGKAAYKNCQGLTSIALPAGLTSMGEYAYSACTELTSFDLGRASRLAVIPAHAFEGSYKLSHITIPAGCTTIEHDAFASCYEKMIIDKDEYTYGLKSVDFSQAASLRTIGDRAFYNNRLTSIETMRLPDGFQSIGADAFYYTGVQKVTFPTSISSIGNRAFKYSGLQELTFLGDARNLAIGTEAFNLYESADRPGGLKKVTFMGKKKQGFESFVNTGTMKDRSRFNTQRTYSFYYNVRKYRNQASLAAGLQYGNVVLKEDTIPSTRLSVKAGQAWNVEDGYAISQRIQDSFYVVLSQDISRATVSGVEPEYDYTGFSIKPVPTLTMPDGTVLVEGRDYIFDPAFSGEDIGYTNNRKMGTAGIHLKGINDYGGTKTATFTILPFYNGESSFTSVTLSEGPFVYNGQPHEPGVTVTAKVKNIERQLVRGFEYSVEYSQNVNAGTAYVHVHGAGAFSGGGERVEAFQIEPLDIRECDFQTVHVDVSALGVIEGHEFTIVSPWGEQLMEGRDFTAWVSPVMVGGRGTVMVSGMGNYAGSWSGTYGPRGGGDGGDGNGGHGNGNGKGNGNGNGNGTQPGKGDGPIDGSGASRTQGDANTISPVDTAPMFGGAHNQVVAGMAGSESGGSSSAAGTFRLYELDNFEPDIAMETDDDLSVQWWLFLLIVAGIILAGIARRSAEGVSQSKPITPRRR